MSKRSLSTGTMVATKHKNKVVPCSTPEHQADSPSRDSDSVCDSEAASPVPFLCTQDGAEGETDVVWNYYTPKAEQTAVSRIKNSTPVSRKARKISKPKLIDRPTPKRKLVSKVSHKKTALFQELMELNQNVHELISKKRSSEVIDEKQSGSEEDIFSDSSGQSPKSCFKSSRCLRKNLLSSKFAKPDTEPALESDDSMNECLIKASQVIEENILKVTPPKKPRYEPNKSKNIKSSINFQMDQDSMDAILNSIKLDSPLLTHTKNAEPPSLNNDSFDNIVGNLNDSTLDRLTQAPNSKSKLNNSKSTSWMIDDIVLHDDSMSKSFFGRHNSMPESPSVDNKPSTSGMVITRYSSMPYGNAEKRTEPSDSPMRCTQDEIKRKHQLAREKLLAKRLLPFTSQSSQVHQPPEIKKKQFQPKFASTINKGPSSTDNVANSVNKVSSSTNNVANTVNKVPNSTNNIANTVNKGPNSTNNVTKTVNKGPNSTSNVASTNNKIPPKDNSYLNQASSMNFQQNNVMISDKSKDIKLLIEKKRQEALMKLRRRQPQK
ncbi:metabotropic glutamate receptor-like protein P [Cydia pomonella]|uniref:metabotropic glutamate receptor-like protein P n=1 Tax=Cydia pomonella TaxID=82600 RepID=UPI002ADD97F6|nr:metabotropic glutamate receptor-like protein P [Cydia pomonella]